MTAWSQAGSLTSDRLPSRTVPQQQQNRGKGQGKNSGSPKSKDVQKLEHILHGLQRAENTKDATGGCFCQARSHSLSKYTPNCLNCGLVLCDLQLPFHLCPHCSTSLVSPSYRDTLIARVEEEITQVLKREEDERIREQQEHERAAGAFPTLAASTGSAEPRTVMQPRHVLSLNSKTGKATLSTYSTKPAPSPPQMLPHEKVVRISPPPSNVDHVKGKVPERPTNWQNLRGEACLYVHPPASLTNKNTSSNKPKK